MNTSTQTAIFPTAQQRIITVAEAIQVLRGYAKERYVAINSHQSLTNFSDKIITVEEILKTLDAAVLLHEYDYQKVGFMVLTLERKFLYVAPRKNMAIFNAYSDKIESMMRQFREFVVYLKSKNQSN